MIELIHGDCMDYMKTCKDNEFDLHGKNKEMQIGKAGEYLVCADLITKGFIAYPSEQGLPYDVVLDTGENLIKVQVKTTLTYKQKPQSVSNNKTYAFNVKRCGKNNQSIHTKQSCDIFALVGLKEKIIGYMLNKDVKQTMFFRVDKFRGTYKDENINTNVRGRYLSDMTLEKILCQR